ncbi:MAG: restriction endonuclease subunit S [Hydrotalea flava]|uniref:restriction endonuclease subunit S n=1 Tax=Hydrotalea lipotrueae TaxID=2803817 RepID=UPI0016AA1618|nr:restriction endonuclease subunit S [Hydrotalea lipotrueae]NIM34990.1 restriction endonuclease subunit S [Hydrotalea flava]NIM37816.1 restriction endonuclease subunit S [Hydrotalea flava]NIN02985.1 restriction endonuclease subunit S [Hydrotalea flava]NIN14670.1 restriction endonuclease subunit S [Hydrotalea flava]NIO93742.1 restriction endonuclease subunit S [Hydrotalea flava]
MSEWKEFKLKDLTTKIGSGATPTGGSNSYKQTGTSLIRSQNVLDFKFTYDGLAFIDEQQANDLKNVIVEEDDVLLNITGDSVARVCKVPKDVLPARVNQHVAIIRADNKKANSDFLLYYLQAIKEYLLIYSEIGGTRNALTKAMIENLDVTLPPLPEQTAIAEVLSSLDDKIDLLHRQNKTLEQLAETLFRQWFVEEAEESWEGKGLDEIADFLNGLACQKFPRKSGENGLPVIKIKEMRTGITESSDWATADVPKKYIIENGDMLFSWSGSLDIVLWFGGKGVLNQHLFKVSSDIYPQWFYYFWTQYHLQEFKGIADDKATTMGHIQRHHLSEATVIVPPKEVLEKMDETINPLFQKIKSNTQQIRTLTQLRDTLLPKLMSGEIRLNYDFKD